MRVSFCQSYIFGGGGEAHRSFESWEGNIYIIRSGHETLKENFVSMKDSWPTQISNNMNKTSRYKHKTKNLIEIYILLIYMVKYVLSCTHHQPHITNCPVFCWKFIVKFIILFSYYKQYNQIQSWHTKHIRDITKKGVIFFQYLSKKCKIM